MHLFHILVPLKFLGGHHLVLAVCCNSCYWFVFHKNVRVTALGQTKGLSTSVSSLVYTRCLGKIIRRNCVIIVLLNSTLAFNHLWFRVCLSSNSLCILKLLMIFSSANLKLIEGMTELQDPMAKSSIQYLYPAHRIYFFSCKDNYFFSGIFRIVINFTDLLLIHPSLSLFQDGALYLLIVPHLEFIPCTHVTLLTISVLLCWIVFVVIKQSSS